MVTGNEELGSLSSMKRTHKCSLIKKGKAVGSRHWEEENIVVGVGQSLDRLCLLFTRDEHWVQVEAWVKGNTTTFQFMDLAI